jgi:sarcosine oxidase subunit gamma
MPENRGAACDYSMGSDRGFVLLQVNGAIASANDWTIASLDLPLPSPGRVYESGNTTVLWLAPQEWLLILPRSEVMRAIPMSRDAGKRNALIATTDLSDAFAHFELSGPAALDLLSSGCSLDLRPPAFGSGQGLRTLFAGIPVIIWSKSPTIGPEPATPRLQLLVDITLAEWLRSWIEESHGAW